MIQNAGPFLLRTGLILCFCTWLICKYISYRQKRMDEDIDKVMKTDRFAKIIKWSSLYFPIVFMTFTINLFSTVYVVRQTHSPSSSARWSYLGDNSDSGDPKLENVRRSFKVEKGSAFLRYRGNVCYPGRTYISNETDSALYLYATDYYYSAFKSVQSPKDFTRISPGRLREWSHGIDYKFSTPKGSSFIYPSGELFSTKWTLDTKEGAIYGSRKIRKAIEMQKDPKKKPLYDY